ncbi:MAG: DUF4249 family protein [Bacillota bacterium]
MLIILSIISLAMILSSCGEGTVDVTEAKYEPKIVMDGYIYPSRKVENIKLTRNFPLNQAIEASQIVLSNADVYLTDLSGGVSYKLSYNPEKFSYEYLGNDLIIKEGKTYKLSVKAVVDGKSLEASSTTTVPLSGLMIKEKYLAPMKYRERDADGKIKNFQINFVPSENCDFYAVSIVPQQADLNSFIYDNAYFKPDSSNIRDNFDNYKYQFRWIQNVNPKAPGTDYRIEWFDLWFYGQYKVIVYAADKNFADYVVTNKSVQEMDGNFHEPKLHIDGQGIGVFGSAIADTVYLKIER